MQFDPKPTVLVVDDAPDNLMLIKMLLQSKYHIKLAISGEIALRVASEKPHPDLILLDVMMPEMDGYDVCRRLKANRETTGIPVIFLSAKNQAEDQRRGFHEGAVDFITKPIEPNTLLSRVFTHLQIKALNKLLKAQNEHLESLVATRTKEILQMQDATMLAVTSLAEMGENQTRNHIRRTQHYIAALARQLQNLPRFAAELSDENIALLFQAAPLHDIGKVGGGDPSTRHPGKLSGEQVAQMRHHAEHGNNTLLGVEAYLGTSSTFLRFAREIAYSHQERFDGSGYPQGLAGYAIPLSARLMTVADVYDALITERPYKQAISHEQALDVIRQGRGSHFDPDIVDALCLIEDQICVIAMQYSDADVE